MSPRLGKNSGPHEGPQTLVLQPPFGQKGEMDSTHSRMHAFSPDPLTFLLEVYTQKTVKFESVQLVKFAQAEHAYGTSTEVKK